VQNSYIAGIRDLLATVNTTAKASPFFACTPMYNPKREFHEGTNTSAFEERGWQFPTAPPSY